MRKVFITGAGGYVGSRLLEHLKEKGYEVVAGVRNRARKLAYERRGIKSLVCEVTDPINVARSVASIQPNVIVHLGGMSQPGNANAEPLEAYQSIVTSWANILDAVRRAVPRAKVVLASACDVYGNEGSDGQPLSENTELRPTTTFGSLKLTAEDIAHTFYRDYHLDVTIARPFHYTGPDQPARFFFGAVADRLASWDANTQGNEWKLPDLSCKRDVLHVDDVVTAYAAMIEAGKPNETYNICSGEARTCRDYVQAMIDEAGLAIQLVETPAGENDARIESLCGDNNKIHNDLGWTPTHTGEQAVRAVVTQKQQAVAEVAR